MQVSFQGDPCSRMCGLINKVQLHWKQDRLLASLFNRVDMESSHRRENALPHFGKIWRVRGLLRFWGLPEGARGLKSEGLFVSDVLWEGNHLVQERIKT